MTNRNSHSDSGLLARFQRVLDTVENRILPARKCMSIELAEKYVDLGLTMQKTDKRCIGVIPLPKSKADHQLTWSHYISSQWLLESIERRKFSGALRLFSEVKKFRAAVLFFEGRVVGSIFSELKGGTILFDILAYQRIVDQLNCTDSLLDLYSLEPALVLSAASLFHCGAKVVAGNIGLERLLGNVLELAKTNFQISTIMLHNQEDYAVAAIYVYLGQVAGVYSYDNGWTLASTHSALHLAESISGGELLVSTLPFDMESMLELFSFFPSKVNFSYWPHWPYVAVAG